MVAGAFGLDPLAHIEPDRGVLLRNKTGTLETARADAGVVSTSTGVLAYAAIAQWPGDAPVSTRDRVLDGMRDLGRALREALGA
jgi:beta-lactamase class A